MRPVSPMLTQSDTAPMVQKWVLFATAPMTSADRRTPRQQHLMMYGEFHGWHRSLPVLAVGRDPRAMTLRAFVAAHARVQPLRFACGTRPPRSMN